MPPLPRVVLASRSPSRKALLQRLLADFVAISPEVDESPRPGESPRDLATRLARAKADAGARAFPASVIIGSDQVARLGTAVLGKPGTAERAVAQLLACSGQAVEFLTAVAVRSPGPGGERTHLDVTQVRFRCFTPDEAERYVAADLPLDCAGSFRAESRGVILMDSIDSRDPTGILGLPLIWVAAALRECGIDLLEAPGTPD
ncbi:MAG: septum formation protein Maf [Gammaproteobacteria bacterium]|nr:septum formation protein Maf [Gammaproteobacteria bacterium]